VLKRLHTVRMLLNSTAEAQLSAGTSPAGAPRVRCERKHKSESGSTLVEFAVVVAIFLLLLFSIADFSRLLFLRASAEEALRRAARYASTGSHLNNVSRADSIKSVATQYGAGLDMSGLQITSALGGTGNPGGPGEMVTLTLSTSLPLSAPLIGQLFPHGAYSFTVKVMFKNEYFPPTT
jgi:Flp pilus assembly protein TadG